MRLNRQTRHGPVFLAVQGGAGRQAAVDRCTHAVEQQKKLLGAMRRQRGRLRAVVAEGKTADRGLFFQKRGHEIVLQRIGADDDHRLAQISALLLFWLLVTVQQHRLDRWDGSVAVCPESVRRWSVLLRVSMSFAEASPLAQWQRVARSNPAQGHLSGGKRNPPIARFFALKIAILPRNKAFFSFFFF